MNIGQDIIWYYLDFDPNGFKKKGRGKIGEKNNLE